MTGTTRIPHDWREWRRLRAWNLKQRGWPQHDIADALDVSAAAVSQWIHKAQDKGIAALRAHSSPGHPPKLTPAQKRRIPEFLWHGAEAYGFRGDVWTCIRIAHVIEWEFGVGYHKDHVSRLLKELNWTPQIPITRAIQRDEEAIARWRLNVWPELRRRASLFEGSFRHRGEYYTSVNVRLKPVWLWSVCPQRSSRSPRHVRNQDP